VDLNVPEAAPLASVWQLAAAYDGSPTLHWLLQCGTTSSKMAQADLIVEGLHGLQWNTAASPALSAGHSVWDIVGNDNASGDMGIFVLIAWSFGGWRCSVVTSSWWFGGGEACVLFLSCCSC